MHFGNYITVFNNITKNFSYLAGDFIGFEFHIDKIISIIINILIALISIGVYYLIGRKIRLFFFRNINYKKFNNIIDVALGYISVNSALAILGLFSLLYSTILWPYIITVLLISIYPYRTLRDSITELGDTISETKIILKKNKWVVLGVILFVFIAFLRLIPPEIGEDAIGYHTGDPQLFLKKHTTIIPAKTPPFVMPAPHLGEMSYLLSEFVEFKDSARYIHFSFYLLTILLLLSVNPYAALFFVTAPVVIQVSSKANVDFQWILCWLVAIFILTQNKLKTKNEAILIGILFGGALASKLWTIAFYPLFILYFLVVYRKSSLISKLNMVFAFSLSALLIDSIWLWRSFIISGNPLYPVLSTITSLDGASDVLRPNSIIGFNKLMFHIKNLGVFSPLLYLGIVISIFYWRLSLKILRKFNLCLFFTFLATEYLIIQYHFGRYLLGLYSLGVLIISATMKDIIAKYNLYKIIFVVGFGTLFFYYFINTLLILPYGFGWADNNKYLTRIISRDNTNYYDFDRLFGKWISNKDKVATYGIYGYYYANFDYIDVNYIFDKSNKSFDLFLQKNVTKLFIKGGDVIWFCKTLNLNGCRTNRVKLLASYPEEIRKYNLYSIINSR